MKKSIQKIIEEYNLEENLKRIFNLENPENNPEIPQEYRGKEEFVYDSLRYLPKMIKEIKLKTAVKLTSPIISPGLSKRSIEFYWKTNDYDLLMNVSENSGAEYYMLGPKNETLAEGKIR